MTSFADGSQELERKVGRGHLVAGVQFPGPSSAALERKRWITGPNAGVEIHNYNGGGPHFLKRALEAGDLRAIARACLNGRGADEAFDQAGKIAERASELAPIREGTLRASPGHSVTDNGATVRDRPAMPSSVIPHVSKGRTSKHFHPKP